MIAVLDYGIGNLRSAEKALVHLGADARLVTDPDEAAGAAGVVLPGVGAFGACAAALCAKRARRRWPPTALGRGTPFLGICIGFQLALRRLGGGTGDAGSRRPGRDRAGPATRVKCPQMQWNRLRRRPGTASGLLAGLGDDPWVYFVHSFAPRGRRGRGGHLRLRGRRDRRRRAGSLWGTQFHPEKSGPVGLAILGNFVRACDAVPPASAGRRREPWSSSPPSTCTTGLAVRLVQGDFARQRTYGDPVELARRYAAAGPAGSTSSTSTRPAPGTR